MGTTLNQTGFLYSFGSITISIILFVTIIIFNELSYRIGRIVQSRNDEEVKNLTGSVQASILGLLALLLGFTFSMSMQRFDNRTVALIDEANSFGTALLRAELLPEEKRGEVLKLLNEYLKLRVAIGKIDLTKVEKRQSYNDKIISLQKKLWDVTVEITQIDSRPVTTGAFMQALNDLIDKQGKRNAVLSSHVPEPIMFLLFFVFIASISIMGYSSGLSGKRILAPLILVTLLITLIVFIIIDLDRPKRGLIKVDQSPLTELVH